MRKLSYYLISYFIFPFLCIEIVSQFIYINQIREKGYFVWKFINNATVIPDELHAPHQNKILKHLTLYNLSGGTKKIRFRTDIHGTIIPSSLEKVNNEESSYVLFCGGSTTESSYIPEGMRVPDFYSKASGVNAVNAGKSGKGLSGCIKTIDILLKRSKIMPRYIVVANNVNTLKDFGDFKNKGTQRIQSSQSMKSTLKKILPGYTQIAKEIRNQIRLSQYLKTNSVSKAQKYDLALSKGCCHGAAKFNNSPGNTVEVSSKKSLPFDWKSNNLANEYYLYVLNSGASLKRLLENYDFPIERVIIFMEPNSFSLPSTAASQDYRQYLTQIDKKRMSAEESARFTRIFDAKYSNAFQKLGFIVDAYNENKLKSVYFYDAVHLTPEGSKEIGYFYNDLIRDRSSNLF